MDGGAPPTSFRDGPFGAGPGIHAHGLSIVRTTAGARQAGDGVPGFRARCCAAPRNDGFRSGGSALAGLEARIGFVDDVDAPLAPHDAAVLVALFQRLERIGDLHDTGPRKARNIGSAVRPVNPFDEPISRPTLG